MKLYGSWREFCYRYNRGAGCSDPCPAGRVHRCEICTSDKHGSKDHERSKKGKGGKADAGAKGKGQKAKGAKSTDAGKGAKATDNGGKGQW